MAAGNKILTVFEVRNGLKSQAIGIQRPWSTNFARCVPAGKQVEFGVNEDPRVQRIAQSTMKNLWWKHREERFNLSAGDGSLVDSLAS